MRYFDVLRRVRVANAILRGDRVVCQLSITGIVLANKSLVSEIDARNVQGVISLELAFADFAPVPLNTFVCAEFDDPSRIAVFTYNFVCLWHSHYLLPQIHKTFFNQMQIKGEITAIDILPKITYCS